MFYADLDWGPPTGAKLAGVLTAPLGTVSTGVAGGVSSVDMAVGRLGDLETCRAGGSSSAGQGAGVFMGEGLPPVPGWQVERIRKWEFLEMYDLLPELLTDQKGGEGGVRQTSRARGWKRVQEEISIWLQRFAVFVGVVAKSAPDAVPGLMAYMVSVIRESQEYEGAAWVAYDAAFRRPVAATGQRDWSKINTSLYTICFTGKAGRSQRCDNCLSAAHKTALGEEDPDASVRAMESPLLALAQGGGPARRTKSADVCRLYNERWCNFKNCKYRHACRWCRGGHAGCDCRSSGRPEPGPMRHDHPRGTGGAAPSS